MLGISGGESSWRAGKGWLFRLMMTALMGLLMDFADAMILVMSVPNLVGVYLLAPVIKRELQQYLAKRRSGEVRNCRTHPANEQAQAPSLAPYRLAHPVGCMRLC